MVAIVSATKVRQLFRAIVKVPKAFITAITYCFVCMCECKCVCVYFVCVCFICVLCVFYLFVFAYVYLSLSRVHFRDGQGLTNQLLRVTRFMITDSIRL